MSFEDIKKNPEIKTYLDFTDKAFVRMGYKEHGQNHARYAAERAEYVLKELGYDQKDQELAKVAAYLHDIGNVISKHDHAHSGAIMFLNFVDEKDFDEDVYAVATAIGNHEDKDTDPISAVAAAIVLGDKTDVRHERLRTDEVKKSDKHSKVIAACKRTDLVADKDAKTISLIIEIDTGICSVMDYFEIFIARTNFCRRASRVLGCNFQLYINEDKLL
ncbi:HD domain-containing protein [Endomicrobium proavitum]|uniref:HD domain-containing protein n=1 Tax=Endomicrobium proavitum TaxID=1408281 RepID=A0A0G3WGY3_9BACT|nr:HD domain-containing protein [Endomicrobium proavitum]AKL97931.1 hypothetical protein Epro_0552 [Endomicrobium proavitum]